jgi:hypothetical protein
MAAPAAAQTAERTIESYDKEFGVKYVALYEEGGYWGNGFLVEGGYKVCVYGEWRCQVIGELMIARFSELGDGVTYKQFAGGIRFGKLMSPKLRTFVQFQLGVQNDGFEDSSNAFVIMPGGGVNYALTEKIDLQVMVDIPIARYDFDGDSQTLKQFRLGFGIGIPLGAN